MKMSKKERSFIEFANNAPAKSELVALEKPAIPELGNSSQFSDFVNQLAELKRLAGESLRQERAVDHNYEIHTRLVNLLSSISEKGQIEDGKDLRFFLNAYNSPTDMTYTFENGKVVKVSAYLVEKTVSVIKGLVEYLSDSKNIKRIKKCPLCGVFFLAKDAKRKICYEMKCRKQYHKEDMKKRRDADPVRYC